MHALTLTAALLLAHPAPSATVRKYRSTAEAPVEASHVF